MTVFKYTVYISTPPVLAGHDIEFPNSVSGLSRHRRKIKMETDQDGVAAAAAEKTAAAAAAAEVTSAFVPLFLLTATSSPPHCAHQVLSAVCP
jgi:hypothetical protein